MRSEVKEVIHAGYVELDERGRVVLPASIRRQLGLTQGDRLVLTLESDRSIKLTSAREIASRTHGMLGKKMQSKALSEELIADRRWEAERE